MNNNRIHSVDGHFFRFSLEAISMALFEFNQAQDPRPSPSLQAWRGKMACKEFKGLPNFDNPFF
jgi:hypothetical protein